MRKEIVEQTKLQSAAFLTMGFGPVNHYLFVINYGETTARNIEVECSPFPLHVRPFLKISTIHKGENSCLRARSEHDERISFSCSLYNFKEEIVFHIKYHNIFDMGVKLL